ncbi:hypothetical protein [Mucilaginibacter segetis]|uniref:DoxX-like protein n=1 Tax=Mucilaginibacter segetis TaxID=2793071 RepID=A0A934PTB9_9SPHI|nr:hypothetical protein [Mucilaginibacter segetis]MBK0380448.1 hypothetical protein [Mucilaginibacter segetis]
MKKTVLFARILLGLIFLTFSIDAVLHFFSENILEIPDLNKKSNIFLKALIDTNYFFPSLKVIEIISAVFLIINRYTAFFIALLFPVTLNIFLFDIFLGTPLLPLGILMFILNAFLLYAYRRYYSAVFTTVPTV